MLFYWELRTEVYWKQWAGVVCVLVVMLACTLQPLKNMPSKKYYWSLLGWFTVVWMVFMSLRASMNMVLPGEMPFPIP